MTPSSLEHAALSTLGIVGDAAGRALLLGIVMGLLLMLFRIRRASLRLWVWTVVLAGAILMPAITRVMPALPVPVPVPVQSSPVARTELRSAIDGRTTDRSAQRPDGALSAIPEFAPIATQPNAPSPAAPVSWADRMSWPVVAAAAYLLGVAFLLLRMLAGWAMAVRLDRRSAQVDDVDVLALLQSHSARARLMRSPRLAVAPDIFVPMTMGVTRPVVLLPDGWREWDAATLDAVLVHELAHIARGDALTQRLSLLYRALTWFSPFGWWLHRHLVDLGEQASDDAALAAGADRAAYAETLVGFFAAIGRAPARADWQVAMASGASVERRVERILSWRAASALTLTRTTSALIVLSVSTIAVAAAAVSPVAKADLPAPAAPASTAMTAAPPAEHSRPFLTPLPVSQSVATVAVDHARVRPSEQFASAPEQQIATMSGRAGTSSAAMIVLLLDLEGSSTAARQRAVEIASQVVHASHTRFTVGLDVPHVWRVVAAGSPVGAAQDFTWNLDEVDAALQRVAVATAPTGVTGAGGAAITAVCDDLARLPPGNSYFQRWPELLARVEIGTLAPIDLNRDAKGVIVFNAGPTLSPAEAANVERACRRQNVTYDAITIAPQAPVAGQTPPVQIGRTYYFNAPQATFGRQLIGLVFDPGLLPGDDLQTATDWALRYIDQGLTGTELVAVSSLGPTAQTLQDFTADRDKLRAAIRTVRTLARDPMGTLEPRVRFMTSLCEAMRRQQMDSNQRFANGTTSASDVVRETAVAYFGTGVYRGLQSHLDLTALETSCARSGVAFHEMTGIIMDTASMMGVRMLSALMGIERAFVLSVPSPVPPFVGISLTVVGHQADSPVTLSSSRSMLDSGYASVVLHNGSARSIRSVSLGALVRAADPSLATPQIFTARGPIVEMPPGASLEISTQLIDNSAFGSLGRDGAAAELGVVEVEFMDGSKWTYDLKAKGHFER